MLANTVSSSTSQQSANTLLQNVARINKSSQPKRRMYHPDKIVWSANRFPKLVIDSRLRKLLRMNDSSAGAVEDEDHDVEPHR